MAPSKWRVAGTGRVCGSRAGMGIIPIPVLCRWMLVLRCCGQEGRGSPAHPPCRDSPLFSPQCMRLVFARESPSARTDAQGSAGSHVGFLRRVGSGCGGNNRQLLGGESRPPPPPPVEPLPPSLHPRVSPGLGGDSTALPSCSKPCLQASLLQWLQCSSQLCWRSPTWLTPRGIE